MEMSWSKQQEVGIYGRQWRCLPTGFNTFKHHFRLILNLHLFGSSHSSSLFLCLDCENCETSHRLLFKMPDLLYMHISYVAGVCYDG